MFKFRMTLIFSRIINKICYDRLINVQRRRNRNVNTIKMFNRTISHIFWLTAVA